MNARRQSNFFHTPSNPILMDIRAQSVGQEFCEFSGVVVFKIWCSGSRTRVVVFKSGSGLRTGVSSGFKSGAVDSRRRRENFAFMDAV